MVEKVGNYIAGTTYENKPAILALGLHGAWLGLCYDEMLYQLQYISHTLITANVAKNNTRSLLYSCKVLFI